MKQTQRANNPLLLVLSLVLVVAVAGCVTTGRTGTGGPGIVIERFEPSLSEIESGEPVQLRLEVRNTGDYNEAPALAELMGIDPTEWGIEGGTIVDLGTLLAPDPESQTQGELATATWNLITPVLSRGQRLTYEPIARVYYYYETRATKPIWFVTSNELRRIVSQGGTLPGETTTYTAGPLVVTIDTGNFVKAREWRESKFQIRIRIDNVGPGQVAGRNFPVAIEVTWPTWVQPVDGFCPRRGDLITPSFENIPLTTQIPFSTFITLWDGKTGEITCEFQIIDTPSSRTRGDFRVKLGYNYFVDATTQIAVKGTEEFI